MTKESLLSHLSEQRRLQREKKKTKNMPWCSCRSEGHSPIAVKVVNGSILVRNLDPPPVHKVIHNCTLIAIKSMEAKKAVLSSLFFHFCWETSPPPPTHSSHTNTPGHIVV